MFEIMPQVETCELGALLHSVFFIFNLSNLFIYLFPPENKTKEAALLTPKPLQPGLYPSPGGHTPLPMPSLVPTPGERLGPGTVLLQRQGEEERWLARQRRLRADMADRQGPASETLQHSTELETHEPQTDTQR